MSTTCMQDTYYGRGPKRGYPTRRRLPHVPRWPSPVESVAPGCCGYTRCEHCGEDIYAQRPDTEEARGLRLYVGGPDYADHW